MVDLGTIERVDLREVWPHEARDFTPWLAENLDVLGEALGLDLKLRSAEAAVGSFSLDVLACDADGNGPVVIENQLEATDHTHLGQLLTYAAGYDAYAVIWLTREFREEHRQVLDWLNHRTGEGTQFFGAVVEAWKIDDSRPAPHFKVMARPDGWEKRASSGAGAGTERWETYGEYWQSLEDALREKDQSIPVGKARADDWYSFPSGLEGVVYSASVAHTRKVAHIGIHIDHDDKDLNKKLFDSLRDKSNTIGSDLGKTVAWDRRDNKRACRIREEKPETIHYDNRDELREWMVDSLLAFKRVFEPHLAELVE